MRPDGRATRLASSGFTLIEALVALAILGVVLGSLLPAIARSVQVNTQSEIRTGAVAAAQQELDNLRASSQWPASGTERSVESGATTYDVTINYSAYCQGGDCFDGAREVTVEVRHHGEFIYDVTTVYTLLDDFQGS